MDDDNKYSDGSAHEQEIAVNLVVWLDGLRIALVRASVCGRWLPLLVGIGRDDAWFGRLTEFRSWVAHGPALQASHLFGFLRLMIG